MAQIVLEIFSKKDCCLCDEMKEIVERVARDFSVEMILTDIETSEDLMSAYGEKIPVLRINGEEAFVYKAPEPRLRKKLEQLQ